MTVTPTLKPSVTVTRDLRMAMTDAERQRKRRERLKEEGKSAFFVRGSNGEYDERIRIAFAVKKLADQQMIPDDILNLIIATSSSVFGSEDILTQRYIKKIVGEYLSNKIKE